MTNISHSDKNTKNVHGEFPKHIAIIMDGNGRWARKRFLPRVAGHKSGVKVVRNIVEYCEQYLHSQVKIGNGQKPKLIL